MGEDEPSLRVPHLRHTNIASDLTPTYRHLRRLVAAGQKETLKCSESLGFP